MVSPHNKATSLWQPHFFAVSRISYDFSESNLSDEVRTAIRYSILGGCINVVGNVFSLFITETAGRRLLLWSSLVGMGGFLAMGEDAPFG